MTTGTRMIIITSNEDLIQQLSKINSKFDQVYKRALDEPADPPSKSVKISRKSICAVCGANAIGSNYDVLTCESCKTFFHRNANQILEKLKCITGDNQCPIGHEIHRKCIRCRLVRCLIVGMKKDELRSGRERLQHIQNLSTATEPLMTSASTVSSDSEVLSETLHDIDNLMMDADTDMKDTLLETLSVDDWLSIEHIRSAFLSTFQNEQSTYSSIDISSPTNALISWSHFFNETALYLIKFFRQLDEFEHLDSEDRFTLIKYNLFLLYPIYRCFNLASINNYSSNDVNDIIERHLQLMILCGASDSLNQMFVTMGVALTQFSERDPITLTLLMIILLLTQGLSMNEEEPPLNDPLSVNRAQLRYTTLLWNYLMNKQGEVKATKQFILLLNIIIRMQSTVKLFQHFFRVQMTAPNTVDSIAPLMQTALHLS